MADTSYITPEVVLGTTTSWLPMTTAYPYLEGCSSAFFLYPGQPFPVAFDPGLGYWAGKTLSCDPPAMTTWWEQGHQNPDGYTSLSIQPITCPVSWTTAVTAIRSDISTNVMCCPSGYNLNGGQPGELVGDCQSPLSSGQILTYEYQVTGDSWSSITLAITAATSIGAIALEGWNVARSTSSTSSSTASKTSGPTSDSAPQPSHGLSVGASAGIGIGVAIGIMGLVLFIFWLFRRQRNRRHGAAAVKPGEADPSVIHEMHHTSDVAHEMYQNPAELESSYARNGVGLR